MSERYVAEYVEIIDDHGERKGVCVTDTEHTASFEVKDEIVALRLCELLNNQQDESDIYEEVILTMVGLLAEKGLIRQIPQPMCLGRVKEFNEDGSITECPYWEAKKG